MQMYADRIIHMNRREKNFEEAFKSSSLRDEAVNRQLVLNEDTKRCATLIVLDVISFEAKEFLVCKLNLR